jgi:hypothetical protein
MITRMRSIMYTEELKDNKQIYSILFNRIAIIGCFL